MVQDVVNHKAEPFVPLFRSHFINHVNPGLLVVLLKFFVFVALLMEQLGLLNKQSVSIPFHLQLVLVVVHHLYQIRNLLNLLVLQVELDLLQSELRFELRQRVVLVIQIHKQLANYVELNHFVCYQTLPVFVFLLVNVILVRIRLL